MNVNVKLDGEEEQQVQYVNRFAFNIPSGAAAFNLNIVNPGLTNQSYILNPMSTVGQSIVTYQPPVGLQSYIALPSENEGNILHSLPVGVPVPVGLPVSTGLLQNNFVNTSIIIGNEDCNSQGVIKSASASSLNPENEIKVNFIEKPVDRVNHKPNGVEVQTVRVNSSPPAAPEGPAKKPCPLEMSIKAANIDMEFEKCEPGIPVLLGNCHAVVEKQPIVVGHVPLESEMKGEVLKVPFEVASIEPPLIVEGKESQKKKIKTEITWENNNKQESVDNGFTESLICEVEEANDDEDDDEVDDEEEEEEEEEEEGGEEVEEEEEEEEDDDDDEDEEEEESGAENANSTSVNSTEGSSEESDSLPLSVAFRRDKHANSKSNKSHQEDKTTEGGKCKQRKNHRSKKGWQELEEPGDWSESDDDVLNLKRIKNEFDYKCFFEPKTEKSSSNVDGQFNKFVRVRSCCSKRECGKKIAVQDQKTAHRNFYNLETNSKREAYLMNCIEYVQKQRHAENVRDKGEEKFLSKLEEEANIQLEIENESNGNQKLSDEIQKAINESLKDCAAANESREGEGKGNEGETGGKVEGVEKTEKNSWNFYIVVDRCRKKVCLQFLLKLFQISKNRIRQLQKKILSGSPLSEESNQKSDVWELAKEHLNEFESVECLECKASPRHRFFTERRTKEDLFNGFRNFHFHKLGKGPAIRYASYKRFLEKKTSLSFCTNQEGICSECEETKKHEKRKKSKGEKGKKGKESKKQWVVKTDSEDRSSDDEPLLKRKKLKLTIPLRAVDGKGSQKRKLKKESTESRSRGGKSKQSGSRGRDVWSLMLLHLETMPYKECKSCVSKKRHRFLDPSLTTLSLFEDYRKYFLKETNSELGLGFTMYEKYFNRNCNYLISDVDVSAPNCPGCEIKS